MLVTKHRLGGPRQQSSRLALCHLTLPSMRHPFFQISVLCFTFLITFGCMSLILCFSVVIVLIFLVDGWIKNLSISKKIYLDSGYPNEFPVPDIPDISDSTVFYCSRTKSMYSELTTLVPESGRLPNFVCYIIER